MKVRATVWLAPPMLLLRYAACYFGTSLIPALLLLTAGKEYAPQNESFQSNDGLNIDEGKNAEYLEDG